MWIPMYAVPIRDAIASQDIEQMKKAADDAQKQLDEQGDLKAALEELKAAIKKLEG